MVVGGGDPGGEEGRRGRARHAAGMLSSPAKNVSCEQHAGWGLLIPPASGGGWGFEAGGGGGGKGLRR